VVIDLDGTLLDTNTFHKWMLFLLKKSFLVSPLDTFKVLFVAFQRVLKQITHKEMKYKILKISEEGRYRPYITSFVQALEKYANQNVINFVDDTNSITILATAAPSLYATHIAKLYRFTHCIATPSTSKSEWFETIKEKKAEALSTLLDSLHVKKCDIVISDHHDDISIMHLANEVFLVNPSQKTELLVKDANISFTKL